MRKSAEAGANFARLARKHPGQVSRFAAHRVARECDIDDADARVTVPPYLLDDCLRAPVKLKPRDPGVATALVRRLLRRLRARGRPVALALRRRRSRGSAGSRHARRRRAADYRRCLLVVRCNQRPGAVEPADVAVAVERNAVRLNGSFTVTLVNGGIALEGHVFSTLRDQRKNKDVLNVNAPVAADITVGEIVIPLPQIK